MKSPKLKLYNLESCPYCQMVRRKLDELNLPYETVDVPGPHHLRAEVIRVSGQPLVPVLMDGDVILDDEEKIIKHLDTHYGSKGGSVQHGRVDQAL